MWGEEVAQQHHLTSEHISCTGGLKYAMKHEICDITQ